MIIWINGAFGAGKTTLAQQLHQRIPEALEFDPEYVGYLLRKWVPMPSSGDFQDIRLWRTLVADFAIGMAQEFQRPLIVPMTLIHPGYRRDVFERIQEADVRLLHVFLELPAEELRRRIQAQVLDADDGAADAAARAFRLAHVERGVATADLPTGTLVLRTDHHTPEQLAELVLVRAREMVSCRPQPRGKSTQRQTGAWSCRWTFESLGLELPAAGRQRHTLR